MSRKFHYFGFLVVVAAVVMVGLTSVSRADFISTSQITGDSDCGVDSSYAYTCAINSRGDPTVDVNGVTFEGVLISGETTSGTNWSASAPGAALYGDDGVDTSGITGNIEKVIDYLVFPSTHSHVVVAFTGLTPGAEYVASFFGQAWRDGRNFTQDLTTTTYAGAFRFDEGEFGNGTGHLVTVKYTAPVDGVWAATFTRVDGVAHVNGGYGMSGFANHLVPEPSTLALLATGLIGLLCYAWRKRK